MKQQQLSQAPVLIRLLHPQPVDEAEILGIGVARVVPVAGDLAFTNGFPVPVRQNVGAGAPASFTGPGYSEVEVEVDLRQLGGFVVESVEKDLSPREPVAEELQQGADVVEVIGEVGVGKAVEAVAVARVEGADFGEGTRREPPFRCHGQSLVFDGRSIVAFVP